MNFNDFFKKLLVAYGVYVGVKYLLNGSNDAEQRLDFNLDSLRTVLLNMGCNIKDIETMIKSLTNGTNNLP